MASQSVAANGRPWYETITETAWRNLPDMERTARAFSRTGCTVAYPTWAAPANCVHPSCRWYGLHLTGRASLAIRLERNAAARDWLGNWGRLLYDPREHGDSPERRTAAARIMRAMRNGLDYATATTTGVWIGATHA